MALAPTKKAKFLVDLARGKAGEELVAKTLLPFYGAKEAVTDSSATHDLTFILADDARHKVEVKVDFLAGKTGNVFIEYLCSKKQSGILATTAQDWAIVVPDKNAIYVFCPKLLVQAIEKSSVKFRQVSGGDRYATRGWLVPLEELEKMQFCTKLPAECSAQV
jgi:hypothetical protein